MAKTPQVVRVGRISATSSDLWGFRLTRTDGDRQGEADLRVSSGARTHAWPEFYRTNATYDAFVATTSTYACAEALGLAQRVLRLIFVRALLGLSLEVAVGLAS